MKKILLSLAFVAGLSTASFSQLSLNEVYSEPNCGIIGTDASDWFEIYNGTGNTINLDCYRFVVVYKLPANQGGGTYAYVFDMPNRNITAGQFFVFSGVNTFCYQGGPTHTLGGNGFNWNTVDGISSSLTRYQLVGGAWVNATAFGGGNPLYKLLQISSQTTAKYNFFLFNANVAPPLSNDRIENALFFGYNLNTPPADITGLPSLSQATLTAGACNSSGTMSFASVSSNEQVTSASGSDNGYARLYNGICGTWVKGGPSTKYSPGSTNNTTPPPAGSGLFSLSTGAVSCATDNSGTYIAPINVNFTESSPYTITYFVRRDNFPFWSPGSPEPGPEDVQVSEGTFNGSGGNQFNITGLLSQTSYFVTAVNAAGCYSATIFVAGPACVITPVHFKLFNANRNRSNVLLKWETSWEQNSAGFMIERNIGGTWEDVSYVPSQAPGGNSDVMLTYAFNDLNPTKGITQYRLRQVDLDGKSKLSDIRAVRGEGQLGKTVIFPNPSFNGNATIVFEDANVKRDVSVIDMSGKIIKQWRNVTNNNLQIENLPLGIFSVRILAIETGEQVVEKIVVNKR